MSIALLQAVEDSTITVSSTDFFDDGEAQFDTGTLGPDVLALGKEIKDGTAVLVYGIFAAVQAIVPMIVYIIVKAFLPTYIRG